MKDDKKTEIKVGISLLVSLIILIWVIAWAKNVDIFSDQKELLVSFNSVAGLSLGDQVSVNGVRKGYVDQISNHGNNVLVKLILDNDVELKKDAQFSIMMLDLMGGKKIEVMPGDEAEPLDYNVTQTGHFAGDISTTMAKLGMMEENIRTIIEELTITLHSVNNIIGDDEFADNLKTSVASLRDLSYKTSLLLDENRKGIKSLLDSTNVLVSNSNKFIENNSVKISETIDQTSILLKNSNELISKIDKFFVEIKEQKNFAGKILYDEKFYSDLKTSVESLKELTLILIEQLKNEGINVDANISIF
ncbi:MAG: MCE family protein [Ignavibacteriales bacterium]|jgi:phospholipid/cholesterol/gamma-HCH transport system substrate-binding protein|nr:MAG: MCE family protein [Ignavibacteriales bacterium]